MIRTVKGAVHAPRAFLEFMADPASERHIPELSSGKSLVLFCASAGRSALAAKTLKDMGCEKWRVSPADLAPWKRQAPRPNTSELASPRARISWQSGGGADDLHPPREDKHQHVLSGAVDTRSVFESGQWIISRCDDLGRQQLKKEPNHDDPACSSAASIGDALEGAVDGKDSR
jgi:hypothetical protein